MKSSFWSSFKFAIPKIYRVSHKKRIRHYFKSNRKCYKIILNLRKTTSFVYTDKFCIHNLIFPPRNRDNLFKYSSQYMEKVNIINKLFAVSIYQLTVKYVRKTIVVYYIWYVCWKTNLLHRLFWLICLSKQCMWNSFISYIVYVSDCFYVTFLSFFF